MALNFLLKSKGLSKKFKCGTYLWSRKLHPDTLGEIVDPSESISLIRKKGGKAIVICDLLSLAKLKTPAELGADIAVGSAQRFGVPMDMEDLMQPFLQLKMNLKDTCRVE